MNFTAIKLVAAIATATAATMMTGAAAQALTVSGNPTYDPRLALPTILTVENEFANNNIPSQGFTNVSGIRVNSLVLKAGSSTPGFNANYGQTVGFLSDFQFGGQVARLNLLKGDRVLHQFSSQSGIDFTSTVDVLFTAIIEGLDGTDFARVSGNFNAVETFVSGVQGPQSFALNITDVQKVPTPALVPAAIGFGAAMLRKRKGEQNEHETSEAKA